MFFTHNLIYLIRFSLNFLTIFEPFPYKLSKKSNMLSFSNSGLKSEIFKYNVQVMLSMCIIFQLFRFQSLFQFGLIYEGILYGFLPLTFVILIRIYFKRNENVVELFNMLVIFEQKLINGKTL